MVFIDLTKAFDSINRTGLWSLLSKFGCPSKLTNIIKQLHEGMMGRVCADGIESNGLAVTVGVKPGCVIAPLRFSLIFAAMLMEATEATRGDYKIPKWKHIQPLQVKSLYKSNRGPHQRVALC